MKARGILCALLGAALAAAAVWAYVAHGRRVQGSPPVPVPIQDGKTLDFSSGSPVVKDGDSAAMAETVKEMDAATRTVTFSGDPPPKK